MAEQHISCPNCGNSIDIDDVLTHQTEERVRKEMQMKLSSQHEELNKKMSLLETQQLKFEEAKKKENELFKERLEKELQLKLTEKEKSITERTQESLRKEFEAKILAQKKMIDEGDEKAKKAAHLEIKLMETERLLKQQKQESEIASAKKLQEASEQIEIEVRKKESEKWELDKKELLKKLDDQKKLTEEMARKQEQGSMQLQGEVQELAIEEYLQRNFILDQILEIKKGVRGGDCMQTVTNTIGQTCGKIYYESKRTKDFQPSWIAKFKDDMRDHKADIGVIVTQAMPKDMERFGLKDGVWICTFEEFKGLCFALRDGLIRVTEVKDSQENKGDKMEMLYDYFTSQGFKDTFNGMMSVFNGMQTDLEKEKRAMTGIWKAREKQIERFLNNAQNMYGSIKGIAGNNTEFLDNLNSLGLPEE